MGVNMKFDDELDDVLRKKALGFSYSEETLEYETARPKSWVFCERRGRLYSKKGYIKAKKIEQNGEIVGAEPIKLSKFSHNEKIFSRLKAFKIKEF